MRQGQRAAGPRRPSSRLARGRAAGKERVSRQAEEAAAGAAAEEAKAPASGRAGRSSDTSLRRRDESAPYEVDVTMRPSGLGMGPKFMLFIAVAVAISSLVMVVLVYVQSRGHIDQEVNEGGKRFTNLVASIPTHVWAEYSVGHFRKNLTELWKAINKELVEAELPDEKRKKIQENTKKVFKGVDEYFQKLFPKKDPLQVLVDMQGKRLDVIGVVLMPKPDAPAGAFPQWLGLATGKGGQISLAKGDVMEKDGELEVQDSPKFSVGGSTYHARIIRTPSWDRGTEVTVALNAGRIEEVQSALLLPIILAAGIAILIGAVVGLFLARSVTRPVRILLKDMGIVSQGQLEHQTVPHSADEIGVLARTFNRMTKSLLVAHEAELENKAREHELSIASEIQSNLLPKRIPKIPGYDIAAYYRPSKEVGGDYYDLIKIDDEHLGIVVADVSGKGIPGSMVMTMARSLLRMEAERNLSAADTLKKTNRILAKDIRRGMFVTCMYIVLNTRTHLLNVVSAGHNPLVLWRQKTRKVELINPNGIALGFDKGPIFDRTIKEEKVKMFPGDRFSSYTDGVVEAMNAENEEFGDNRFYGLCKQLADKDSNRFTNLVVRALDDHQGEASQHDDITMVTFRLQPR